MKKGEKLSKKGDIKIKKIIEKSIAPQLNLDTEVVLDYSKIYRTGWDLTKQYFRKYAWLILIIILINIVDTGLNPNQLSQNITPQEIPLINRILSLILSLFSFWLSIGIIAISLRILDKKSAQFMDGIVDLTKTGKAFIARIITVLFTILGLILFIVPGIIISARLLFVTTLILDKNLGVWEAIKTSRSMTEGSVRKLIMISLVTGLSQLLGLLTLGIGLFRTIPFMFLAETLAYRTLRDHILNR